MTHAVLLATWSMLVVLPLAASVAGGVSQALSGKQGTAIFFIQAAMSGAVAGALFGVAMVQHEINLRR